LEIRSLKLTLLVLPVLLAGCSAEARRGNTVRPAPARPLSSVARTPAARPLHSVQSLAGVEAHYRVRPGETLLQIARRCNTDRDTLARLNDLAHKPLRPGRRLLLPTRTILPAMPTTGVVLNIPERGLYVFRKGRLLARYPVAVGRPTWQTPRGKFTIDRMVLDPIWLPPEAMVKREGTKEALIPPGPRNPLGDRWMGWGHTQVGFHTTYTVSCIGHAASHGCVRMYPEAGHRMFTQVFVGMPVYSLYQPVKIGRDGERVYLSVSPDIYHTGLASYSAIQKRLTAAGLSARVDSKQIRQIAARQDGYPHLVASLAAGTQVAAR